ncbi:MAG: DUF4190 domain-containing protein [Clostridia bacterium]|nr:DUF4190 domain-containing protein [Clostridia bacterium]
MEKYCTNCGTKMNETDRFCPNCGADSNTEAAPVQNNVVQQNYSNAQANNNNVVQGGTKKTNGLAVTSFVCSMVGIVVFGLVMGILAICFGAVGLSRTKYFPEESGKGFAVAGIVVGIIEVIIMILYIVTVRSSYVSLF